MSELKNEPDNSRKCRHPEQHIEGECVYCENDRLRESVAFYRSCALTGQRPSRKTDEAMSK